LALWAGAIACWANTASAQATPKRETETYALSFVRGAGAEGCPSKRDLGSEVSARLGHSPFDPSAPRSIEILTEATPEGYRSVVSALDRDGKLLGRRVLLSDEPSCAPIFSATALAVALLIDPEAALSRDSTANEAVGRFETDDVPQPPPVATPAPTLTPPPSPSPPSRTRTSDTPPPPPARETGSAMAGVDVGLAFGLVPEVSPSVGIFVDGRPDPLWGFVASAQYVSSAPVESDEAALDVSLTTFGLAVTLSLFETRAFRFASDLGLLAGALHVGVREGQAIDSGDHAFIGANLGLRAEVRVINGLFLTTRVGGVVPFVSRGLFVEGAEAPIWREPAVAGTATLGLGWAFF